MLSQITGMEIYDCICNQHLLIDYSLGHQLGNKLHEAVDYLDPNGMQAYNIGSHNA
jgi:hypothetical protein